MKTTCWTSVMALVLVLGPGFARAEGGDAPWNRPIEGGGKGQFGLLPHPGGKGGKAGEVPQGVDDLIEAPPVPREINPGFAAALYQQLRQEEGNVFFSPTSISQAMGMAYAGARGRTAEEIGKAMGFAGSARELAGRMSGLRVRLEDAANGNDDQLRIANAVFVTGARPLEDYLQLARTRFGAEAFHGGLEDLNGWVRQQTGGHIDRILEQLDANSACVLLNAVYFKGTWESPFRPSGTHDGAFHLTPAKSVEVKLMSQRGTFAMVRNEQWVAVELPYRTSCSMVLVMPAKAEDFGAFEAGIRQAFVEQVCGQLKGGEQEIELVLPKFKIATTYDLVPPMKSLGMADAFDGGLADFSGMYRRDDIHISQIKHKATLEVDELGSVASAATAVEMAFRGLPAPAPIIRFDRPFLVLIRERQTQSTLFMGRISDPTAK